MREMIRPGVRLPNTTIAELDGQQPVGRSSNDIFAGKRVILIGVPAAFSPICTRVHVGGFVRRAPDLLASHFDMIACIAANDPWVLAEWRKQVDPNGTIRFLSDGNLQFGRACLLTTEAESMFIGTRLKRFVIIAANCLVERCAIEDTLEVTCSGADRF